MNAPRRARDDRAPGAVALALACLAATAAIGRGAGAAPARAEQAERGPSAKDRAAAEAELRKWLALPLSAGSVALLVGHAPVAAVQERWAAALADPRGEVRAAAARCIHARGVLALAPQLREALAKEQDPDAAREQVRALGLLGAEAADVDLLFAHAKRLGGELPGEALVALARGRGEKALDLYLDRAAELPVSRRLLALAYLVMTRREAGSLSRAASRSLGRGSAEGWEAAAWAAAEAKVALGPGLVLAGLGAAPPLSTRTAWLMLSGALSLPPETAEVRAAAEAALAAAAAGPGGGPDADELFGLELIRRRAGGSAVERPQWIAWLAEGRQSRLADMQLASAADAPLTAAEREALGGRLKTAPADLDPVRSGPGAQPGPPRRAAAPSALDFNIRTAAGFPKGFVAGLVDAAGCRLQKTTFGYADVVFFLDGRPAEFRLGSFDGHESCRPVISSLIAASLLPPDARAGPPEVLMPVLRAEQRDCWDADLPLDVFAPHVGLTPSPSGRPGTVTEPRKIRDERPQYPEAARQRRSQGTVVIEGIVNTRGCFGRARVVSTPDLALIHQALKTVTGWRYTPTLLDGEAVPVYMTVTVNFRLH